MKKILLIGFLFITMSGNAIASKIEYWDVQRRGANNFNGIATQEKWFEAAAATGIEWVRLAWGKRRNFLMGSADNYAGLVQKDLAEIKQSIGYAKKYGIKIVLVPISLPGAEFRQLRNGKNDMRIWSDKKYWVMAANMWKDLAREFKDNKNVVAYNIFNEPYPESGTGVVEQGSLGDSQRYYKWSDKYKGTARDLEAFHRFIIKAIRSEDKNTPIMVESGWYAQPNTFVHWKPIKDDKVLYQFHMYEPYKFTAGMNYRKKLNLVYPGTIPFGNKGEKVVWDRDSIKKYFSPFEEWVKANNIPSSRIVAGEFGCMRRNKGCDKYLTDVLEIFNRKKYHWAFYSFRETAWGGYDYELGDKKAGWAYWKDIEAGKSPESTYSKRKNNALWAVIKKALNAPK